MSIYESDYEFEKYPIIRINFKDGKVSTQAEIQRRILYILKDNQKDLGIECETNDNIAECFKDIIKAAHKKYNKKVVILVDEYDKPILDNIENTKLAEDVRDGLVNFYSVHSLL